MFAYHPLLYLYSAAYSFFAFFFAAFSSNLLGKFDYNWGWGGRTGSTFVSTFGWTLSGSYLYSTVVFTGSYFLYSTDYGSYFLYSTVVAGDLYYGVYETVSIFLTSTG